MTNYLTKILNATVYDVAAQTPLDEAAGLSAKFGCRFLLKREDLQSVHSYKIRGAYNKIRNLSPAEQAMTPWLASSGERLRILL